jgi:hypothetical protein
MSTTSKIEQQVMASVAVIHTTRKLTSMTALKVYALVLSLWSLAGLVWVARVQENFLQVMNGGVLAVGNFVLSAFTHTSTLVQLVSLVLIFALGSLVVDLARSVSAPRSAAY